MPLQAFSLSKGLTSHEMVIRTSTKGARFFSLKPKINISKTRDCDNPLQACLSKDLTSHETIVCHQPKNSFNLKPRISILQDQGLRQPSTGIDYSCLFRLAAVWLTVATFPSTQKTQCALHGAQKNIGPGKFGVFASEPGPHPFRGFGQEISYAYAGEMRRWRKIHGTGWLE